MSSKNILVTITGPSVTGKSKLAALLKPYGFEELVSTTTRPPRAGEIHGVHYNFVDQKQFDYMVKNNLMIEKVTVGSKSYGVSRPALDEVISRGKNGVAVVEPLGAQEIRKFCSANGINLHQVFIDNPEELLVQRLLERYKSDNLADSAIYATRLLEMVKKEDLEWRQPAYNGTHDYDQIFSKFGQENEQTVVNSILSHVSNKLEVKKNNRPKLG